MSSYQYDVTIPSFIFLVTFLAQVDAKNVILPLLHLEALEKHISLNNPESYTEGNTQILEISAGILKNVEPKSMETI